MPFIVKNVQDGAWIKIPLISSTTEKDTEYDLPAGAVLYPWEMFLEVVTAQSGRTIDVGIGFGGETGADADGFIAAAPISATGLFCVAGGMASASGAQMYTATVGTNQIYLSVNKIGALFFGGQNGLDQAGRAGLMAMKAYIGNGVCKSLSYTCSSGTSTFVGNLIFKVNYMPFTVLS